MDQAELYRSSNSLQRRDAARCLRDYQRWVPWRGGERVLDIGCGDGSVTNDILKPTLPPDATLRGCDLSARMVEFANESYRDERTSFCVLDVEGSLPAEMLAAYDRVFSFYVLHWIRDQDQAFVNIQRLLRADGRCLLLFLGRMPLFDVYRILGARARWRSWLGDVEHYVSPYHDSKDPEAEVRKRMKRAGFRRVDVRLQNSTLVYNDLDVLRRSVMAVNPFAIPKRLQEDFMSDYLEVLRDLGMMEGFNNNVGDKVEIRTSYTTLVAFGLK